VPPLKRRLTLSTKGVRMSNVADLKALLITKAADITFDLDKLECLSDIDAWYNARVAVETLSATDVSSYSIAGRTVTRTSLPSLKNEVTDLYAKIIARLYGAGGLVDERYPYGGFEY
jgi:hypothetical protein